MRHYAVLREGLQQISPVVAAILRNTNSYGLNQPPRLGADDVARLPVASAIDDGAYPGPVTIVDAADEPLTCAQWSRPADATESPQLLSGVTLPLSDGLRAVDLVGAGRRRPPTGWRWRRVMGISSRRSARTPASPRRPDRSSGSATPACGTAWNHRVTTKDVAALGLTPPPLPIPWSMLSQFAAGSDVVAC